ncbi:MAG: RluA family pseudouridine synthase [Polyangiaceae bacterium]
MSDEHNPGPPSGGRSATVPKEHAEAKLDAFVRAAFSLSWARARDAIGSGKVLVDGEVARSPTRVMFEGDVVSLDAARPRPHIARLAKLEKSAIVYLDPSVVVVDKPSGISTVPFGDESPDAARETLDALVREILARKQDRFASAARGRAPLGVVHRIDKETSGLLVFTRTLAAKKHLADQFRTHSTMRRYLAIVHGTLTRQVTYRTTLVENRGDGLRGSTRSPRMGGQLAITHVEPLEPLVGATLVACRLETGRTHQIRIHLSEAGLPLVGESVYVRDFRGPRIPAPRTMLHAFELGFTHPATEERMQFRRDPPRDFAEMLASLAVPGPPSRP